MRIALTCVVAALAALPAAAETRIVGDGYNNSGFVGFKGDDFPAFSEAKQYDRAQRWGECVVGRQPDLSVRYLTAIGRDAIAVSNQISGTFMACFRSVGWLRLLNDPNIQRAAIGDALRARL